MACFNTCHETGHLIVEELTYSPKRCSVCHKRCLFRTRKMIRCIACKCVTHKRCWAAANRSVKVLAAPEEELRDDVAIQEMVVSGGDRPEASQVVDSEIKPEPLHVVSVGEEAMPPRATQNSLDDVVDDVESKEKDTSVDDKSPTIVAISHVESGDANNENGASPASVAINCIESGEQTVSEDFFTQTTVAISHVVSDVEELQELSSPSNDRTEARKDYNFNH